MNLANTLIDMLYLGKEAVYRRLRGEVPFTLAEAATISQKMGVSLDKLVGSNKGMNAIFDLNIIHYSEPLETYYSIVDNYVKIFQEIKGDPSSGVMHGVEYYPADFLLEVRVAVEVPDVQVVVPVREDRHRASLRGASDGGQAARSATGFREGVTGV